MVLDISTLYCASTLIVRLPERTFKCFLLSSSFWSVVFLLTDCLFDIQPSDVAIEYISFFVVLCRRFTGDIHDINEWLKILLLEPIARIGAAVRFVFVQVILVVTSDTVSFPTVAICFTGGECTYKMMRLACFSCQRYELSPFYLQCSRWTVSLCWLIIEKCLSKANVLVGAKLVGILERLWLK